METEKSRLPLGAGSWHAELVVRLRETNVD